MTPRIILVGADKGGVGKTTVARVLIDRAAQLGPPPRVVDTEPAPGVLKRFYPNAELIDVRAVAGQMSVFDNPTALTVVDVRAGLLLNVLKSLRDAGLFADAASGSVSFAVVHIMEPSYASASEIAPAKEIIATGGVGASHTLVQNHIKVDQVYEATNGAFIIPNLDFLAARALDTESTTPEAFVVDASRSRVLRGNVRHWLDDIYPELKRVGLESQLALTVPTASVQ